MERGQGVLFLELFNSIFGEIYDSFQLEILGHRHESQGCFCHCGDWCPEDGIRSIVEFILEVAWREMSTFGRTSPAHFFVLFLSLRAVRVTSSSSSGASWVRLSAEI